MNYFILKVSGHFVKYLSRNFAISLNILTQFETRAECDQSPASDFRSTLQTMRCRLPKRDQRAAFAQERRRQAGSDRGVHYGHTAATGQQHVAVLPATRAEQR